MTPARKAACLLILRITWPWMLVGLSIGFAIDLVLRCMFPS